MLTKYNICGGPGSIPGPSQVMFMVDNIAVEHVFHQVLVSCSTNAKYSLRGGTVGSKNKGL
jgi:hypothetical protein